MKKDELFQKVKSGEITINDARKALGFEKGNHPLLNSLLTNKELLLKCNK